MYSISSVRMQNTSNYSKLKQAKDIHSIKSSPTFKGAKLIQKSTLKVFPKFVDGVAGLSIISAITKFLADYEAKREARIEEKLQKEQIVKVTKCLKEAVDYLESNLEVAEEIKNKILDAFYNKAKND